MAKKSQAQRIARLEQVCIGAGFLLKKLQYSYGERFGIGMGEQVSQCINDINQIERSRALRTASTTKEQKA